MNNSNKWAPILESIGISKDHARFADLCEYAEIQKNLFKSNNINESVNNANQYNTQGFGKVVAPGINGTPGQMGTAGSGDIAQMLLPASVKIAAHTPGLNLVPVINVNSNRVDMLFYDWKYDDYATFDNAGGQEERGTTFKLDLNATQITALKAFVIGQGVKIMRGILSAPVYMELTSLAIPTPTQVTDSTVAPKNKLGVVEFKGFSKIDNMPMFRIFTQDNAASTGGWGFNGGVSNTLPNDDLSIAEHFSVQGATLTTPTPTITTLGFNGVAIVTWALAPTAAENKVTPAFEVSLHEDVMKDFTSNRNKTGMARDEWDASTANKIGMDSFVKTIQIGVRHIAATLRLSEINDYQRMHGINIVDKTREQLVTQIQQEISIEIVEKVKEMGEKNRQELMTMSGGVSMFDLDIAKYTGAGLYESSFSLTRVLWKKVIGASFFIKTDGKFGNADYAVVSGTMVANLSEMNGYSVLPMKNNQLNLGKSIEAIGSLDGITVYVDPHMMPGDNTIYLGRVGTKEDPGLKFFAYMLAENVEVTSERTMAPHLYLYTRYAIGEYGFFPQKQYMAIHVEDAGQQAEVLW